MNNNDELEAFIRKAYALARSAIANGNHPFGALLVHQGVVILEYENKVVSSKNITEHAETGLLALASQTFSKEILATSTLYSSTEPCLMCCGAIHWTGIAKVVFGCSALQMATTFSEPYRGIPCKEIFARINPEMEVIGPVLEEIGLEIHQGFWPTFLKSEN